MTQTQNRSSLVLRIAVFCIDLGKTFLPLRQVLAPWLVGPKVHTQKYILMNKAFE